MSLPWNVSRLGPYKEADGIGLASKLNGHFFLARTHAHANIGSYTPQTVFILVAGIETSLNATHYTTPPPCLLYHSVLSAPQHVETWRFDNWSKYKNDKAAKGGSWASEWGIPKSSGWAWPKDGGNYDIVKDPSGSSDMVLRVEYPKGSSNPANTPQGGIGFYAQPIELREEAKLVVLEYKLFFPKGFDFVKGGKLPGLYGGHEGCSGGADASSCFSTR